jgi:hypothetical protein
MIQAIRYAIMNTASIAADDMASFPPIDWPSWIIFFLLELRRNHAGEFDNVWTETIEKVEDLGWDYWQKLWEAQLPEVWRVKSEQEKAQKS